MGLLTPTNKEQVWNLHFRDDNAFIFRKLDVEKGWGIERDAQGKAIKAYMIPYKLQKEFDGFGKVPQCKLLITYPRDVLFDAFSQLAVGEKPEKGRGLKEKMMANIAAATVYQHEIEAKPTSSTDKMILFVGAVMVLLGLSIGAQILINRGGG